MSNAKYFVIVIVGVGFTIANCKPSGMELSLVMEKSICRTVADTDENDSRIPRVIKVLRCAPDPYRMCPSSSGGEVRCCGALTDAQFSCTDVLDSVLVSNTDNETYTINVPVGCACIKHNTNIADE